MNDNQGQGTTQKEKIKNAYLLFYDRVTPMEEPNFKSDSNDDSKVTPKQSEEFKTEDKKPQDSELRREQEADKALDPKRLLQKYCGQF